jgi:acetyl-CoA carboxylase biotin carboxylase subunit
MEKPFRKILIANRGEVAMRIMRTCRAMGIVPVAVYSEADRRSPHVRCAEEAVCIGAAPSKDSYLHIEKILEAAAITGAEAIHPGYGFLAENADFAAACERSGIVFIGPSSEVIRSMGSKIKARAIMEQAGVPVLPGYGSARANLDGLCRKALAIGLPVLVKASAGGGGRGMRLVTERAELRPALETARREAESAFGDGTLLVEKYIEAARHVEIQILGDIHGNLIHLFERECSIQRRHQKIVEESPSPAVDADLRSRMVEAALQAARASGYCNAGTVEFLLASSRDFYFIEVNARLQVEHPVTEMVTGLDLVRLQIESAQGQRLRLRQDEISCAGHAIEARLYAEDPENGFLPSAGTIYDWHPPTPASGLRIDQALEQNLEVGVYYDSLLAKVISHAEDRETATRKLVVALRQLSVAGVATNREFLVRVLDHPQFCNGSIHTGFIEQHANELLGVRDPRQDFEAAAAVALYLQKKWQSANPLLRCIPPHFRNNPLRDAVLEFQVGADRWEISYRHLGGERYMVGSSSREAPAEIICFEPGILDLAIAGVFRRYRITEAGELFFVHSAAGSRTVTRLPRFPDCRAESQLESARAMLPGQVLQILVEVGQHVKMGDALVILEAMKIHQTTKSHMDGTVEAVLVRPGEVVAPGDLLVRITAQDRAAGTKPDGEA